MLYVGFSVDTEEAETFSPGGSGCLHYLKPRGMVSRKVCPSYLQRRAYKNLV